MREALQDVIFITSINATPVIQAIHSALVELLQGFDLTLLNFLINIWIKLFPYLKVKVSVQVFTSCAKRICAALTSIWAVLSTRAIRNTFSEINKTLVFTEMIVAIIPTIDENRRAVGITLLSLFK